jgi:hypothetical protein
MQIMNIKPWYIQASIVLVPLVVLSVVFPIAAWLLVIAIFHGVEQVTGYHTPLVGEPGGIDPGAVLVTTIYLVLCIWATYRFYRKDLYISSIIVALGAILAMPYIFSMVSSIIWF